MSKTRFYLGLLSISVAFVAICFFNIGKFISMDEPRLLEVKIPKLGKSWENKNWENCFPNDKPATVSGLLVLVGEYFADIENFDYSNIETYLTAVRIPGVLYNLILTILSSLLLAKVVRRKYALMFFGLVLSTPILIGLSQIINADSTLWSSAILAFVSFFLLIKRPNFLHFSIAGISLGLVMLSKFNGGILYYFFTIMIVLEYLFFDLSKNSFKKLLLLNLGVVLLSMLVFFILYPPAWVEFSILFKKTINIWTLRKARSPFLLGLLLLLIDVFLLKFTILNSVKKHRRYLFYLIAGIAVVFFCLTSIQWIANLFGVELFTYRFLKRGNGLLATLFASINSLHVPLTVIFIAGIVLAIKNFVKNKAEITSNEQYLAFVAFTFVAIYILGVSASGIRVQPRYLSLLLAPYALFSAYGFLSTMSKKWLIGLSVLAFLEIGATSPYYFQYSGIYDVRDSFWSGAWGMGGYQLAEYTNTKIPYPESKKVYIESHGFEHFFSGVVEDQPDEISKTKVDYFALTNSGEAQLAKRLSGLPSKSKFKRMSCEEMELLEYYYQKEPVYEVKTKFGRYLWKLVEADPEKHINTGASTESLSDDISETNLDLSRPFCFSGWIHSDVENGLVFTNKQDFHLSVKDQRITFNLSASDQIDFSMPEVSGWHHYYIYGQGNAKGSGYGAYVNGLESASSSLTTFLNGKSKVVQMESAQEELSQFAFLDGYMEPKFSKNIFTRGYSFPLNEIVNYNTTFLPSEIIIEQEFEVPEIQ